MQKEYTSKAPQRAKKVRRVGKGLRVSTDWSVQLVAFVDCMSRLGGRRALEDGEWERAYGLYKGLKGLMPAANWKGLWKLARRRKEGFLTLPVGSSQARTLDAFIEINVIRDAHWAMKASKAGYWVAREKAKLAANPVAFRASAAARQRKYQERKQKQKALYARLLAESMELDDEIRQIIVDEWSGFTLSSAAE